MTTQNVMLDAFGRATRVGDWIVWAVRGSTIVTLHEGMVTAIDQRGVDWKNRPLFCMVVRVRQDGSPWRKSTAPTPGREFRRLNNPTFVRIGGLS